MLNTTDKYGSSEVSDSSEGEDNTVVGFGSSAFICFEGNERSETADDEGEASIPDDVEYGAPSLPGEQMNV